MSKNEEKTKGSSGVRGFFGIAGKFFTKTIPSWLRIHNAESPVNAPVIDPTKPYNPPLSYHPSEHESKMVGDQERDVYSSVISSRENTDPKDHGFYYDEKTGMLMGPETFDDSKDHLVQPEAKKTKQAMEKSLLKGIEELREMYPNLVSKDYIEGLEKNMPADPVKPQKPPLPQKAEWQKQEKKEEKKVDDVKPVKPDLPPKIKGTRLLASEPPKGGGKGYVEWLEQKANAVPSKSNQNHK